MATGGRVTNSGAKLVLDRAYSVVPTRSIVSKFRIGAGDTTPTISDTSLDIDVPINTSTVETADDCETADWTEAGAGLAETLNSTTFKEGSNALNLPKDDSGVDANWNKTTTSINGTGKDLFVWVYIKDATALAKFATTNALEIRFGSDGSNYYYVQYNASALAIGWNLLKNTIGSMSSTGSPAIAALDYSYINLKTTNATDTFAAGDVIMDYWHVASDDDYLKNISSGGSITIDETNKRVEIRCFVSSIDANGYLLKEVGLFNTDGTPLMESRDVYTEISKANTDEIVYIITHALDNT